MKPTKEQLLEHYSKRDPKLFFQFDGFDESPNGSTNPEARVEMFRIKTYELMRGNDVRILIDPRKDREKVLRTLHKLVSWIEGDGGTLCWSACRDDQIWINESRDIALYRGRTYPIDSDDDLEALKRLQRENMADIPF